MAEQNVNSSATTTISLEETLKAILPDGKVDGKLPPVHLWNPERSADINMEIRADGSWWHEGDPINRERLVKLFSRILRKDEDGSVWLVTPYEKVIVHVADAPFLAVRVERAGEAGPQQTLAFVTNLGDVTLAGPDAPLRVETDPETGEPSPYVLVRGQLEAKLARPVFYELANMAEPAPDGSDMLGVWSQGVFFPLGPAA
ncbi:MAG TPA: DUF1285 domain-containing protein [Hyphomonas sp.]|jgi:hypothetical protein|uniref:DUF1285 domain-containing protein n=1 Tax=unclassified Hyphomonas TaxID=2630699 RepID=UPI000C913E1D|nr:MULTISPECIES: DUF1285 domain-containing protein [unclassified Hyphomonas]QSR23601.1 hypothetical protein CFA77_15005 [Hyphomonas sp. KY3]MAL44997.1 hypothetical protein [Hyphomonas sp.]HBT34833.1 DUF1285 domain-containing protein [Hyphomonas sp.]HBX91688.1 DUF1285 domain-containing protein [Hyphomonas sp.]HBX95768.1 DUF1285 domain-containing protein [Hyphomonas sp.]|tara:strand:+ start:736 stop:1338 length:603 start_codon:yes stop_codon:yes gene_type:complete